MQSEVKAPGPLGASCGGAGEKGADCQEFCLQNWRFLSQVVGGERKAENRGIRNDEDSACDEHTIREKKRARGREW